MELKYTKTGDYELPNLTLNDNKKGAINKYGMLKLDYLKARKKSLYTTLLIKDEKIIRILPITTTEIKTKSIINKEDIETKYGIVTYNPNKPNTKGND